MKEVLGQTSAGYSGCVKTKKKYIAESRSPETYEEFRRRLKGSVATLASDLTF